MIYLPTGKFENIPQYIKKLNFQQASSYIQSEQARFTAMKTSHPNELRESANLYRQYLVEKFDMDLPDNYTYPTFSEDQLAAVRADQVNASALLLISHLETQLGVSRDTAAGAQSLADEIALMKVLDPGVTDRNGRRYVKHHAYEYDYAIVLLNK